MSSPEIIDLNDLLSPVSEENPAGSDIRKDSSPTSNYYLIKDARNSARAAERNSLFDGGSDEANENWRKIIDLAPKILREDAKDLEIASWYTEALIRRYGFQGLRDGFTLISGLIEHFWEHLHPEPDEDGIETRVASLTGLNGEGAEGVLIPPIRNTPITQDLEPGPFTIWQYRQAMDAQKVSDEELRDKKIAQMGFSVADIEQTVANSSDDFYINLRDDLNQSIEEYRKVRDMLDTHCGVHDAPPTSNIINALEDTLSTVRHLAKLKLPEENSAEPTDDESSDNGTEMSNTATSNPAEQMIVGTIKTRDDAFKQLNQIAEFFRKTEPHSPVSYAIDRAIKWGDMPLSELMKELISDSSSRESYSSLTGVDIKD